MTWANALNARWKRLSRYASLGHCPNCPLKSEGVSPIAAPMNPGPSRDVMRLLELRALRLNNRHPDRAARYLQKHLILIKGGCSNG